MSSPGDDRKRPSAWLRALQSTYVPFALVYGLGIWALWGDGSVLQPSGERLSGLGRWLCFGWLPAAVFGLVGLAWGGRNEGLHPWSPKGCRAFAIGFLVTLPAAIALVEVSVHALHRDRVACTGRLYCAVEPKPESETRRTPAGRDREIPEAPKLRTAARAPVAPPAGPVDPVAETSTSTADAGPAPIPASAARIPAASANAGAPPSGGPAGAGGGGGDRAVPAGPVGPVADAAPAAGAPGAGGAARSGAMPAGGALPAGTPSGATPSAGTATNGTPSGGMASNGTTPAQMAPGATTAGMTPAGAASGGATQGSPAPGGAAAGGSAAGGTAAASDPGAGGSAASTASAPSPAAAPAPFSDTPAEPTTSVEHYANGNKRRSGAQVLDPETGLWQKDGLWTEWANNGRKISEGRYANGKKVGPWREWHANGKKKCEETFVDGRSSGPMNRWHANGQLALHRDELRTADGHVLWIEDAYFDNGAKRSRHQLRDGVRQGPSQTWWRNRKPSETGAFAGGSKDGVWLYWDERGAEQGREIWVDGSLRGEPVRPAAPARSAQ